jgi:phospholipid/cholesterol/gamma-HCH transport system substrate-binding protein
VETRANYALIGLFTLAIIFGIFTFAYWFIAAGQRTAHKTYVVHFVGSVYGLDKGNSVLFNGLKVGEVSDLGLMPDDPNRVFAKISVDARTPVKADTAARLETGALTSVARVSLEGGDPAAPPLADNGVIDARPSQLQDLLAQAQKLSGKVDGFLERANKLVDDNGPALTASVTNMQTLTGALADSSGSFRSAMESIDPAKIRSIVENADKSMSKVNALLGDGAGKTMVADIADAARSMKKLAENLSKFTNTGLRQYESLAVDGRRTLQDVDHAVRQLEKNPQSIIFGNKPSLPEYQGH